MDYLIRPGGCLRGTVHVPGDKSISHRSIMLGAIADGVSEVEGFLEGEDALATMNAFRAMGVRIDGPDRGRVIIHGVGKHGLLPPAGTLDCGNSGTSMRLMAGLLAGQGFEVTLDGDSSLRSRPMKRVTEPLSRMGAVLSTRDGRPPVVVRPGAGLQGLAYEMPVASAQVKSAVLLAGLYAEGTTAVVEPAPTRDHTERMLRAFGYAVEVEGGRASLMGGGRLTAARIDVPADISSAAFFLVGASIAQGSELLLQGVGVNPTRTGVIEILRLMGADIAIEKPRVCGAEPVADLRVRSAPLKGIRIPEALVPLAIDEFPALFIAAACASGETLLSGAEELRVKESDRIAVMAEGLNALGIRAEPTLDGMRIVGGPMHGGDVDSHGDHRIAMSFAMAGLVADGEIRVRNCSNVATSFPGFETLACAAGVRLEAVAA